MWIYRQIEGYLNGLIATFTHADFLSNWSTRDDARGTLCAMV